MTYERALEKLSNLHLKKTKEEKIERLLKIKKYLIKCNDSYYTSDEPLITDREFDKLSSEYQKALKLFKLHKNEELIFSTGLVKDNNKKLQHQVLNLLGTLEKANNMDDVKEWVKKKKELLEQEFILIASLKYDGNSLSISYNENGSPINATTRGKNGLGEDVSFIFKNHKIFNPLKKEIVIKYEVITTDENYENLINSSDVKYANNRSVVSGIMGRKDGDKFARFLSLVPLEIKDLKTNKDIPRLEQLKLIDEIVEKTGFPLHKFEYFILEDYNESDDYDLYFISIKRQLEKLETIYNEINSSERLNLKDFMFDGIVIEIADDDIRKELSYDNNVPNFAIALKFPYLEKATKVVGARFDYGRSGRITPVIQYTPIEFFGNVQQFTSVANYKRFEELSLNVGDTIVIQYRNDVLSYISKVVTKSKTGKKLEFIEICPFCDGDLQLNETEVFVSCENPKCKGRKLGEIEQYCINMGMKGIRYNILNALFVNDIVTKIRDLYNPELYEHIKHLEGFGIKSAENIKNIINSNKEKFDYEVLASLSITGINQGRSKELMKHFNLDELIEKINNNDLESIKAIEGFGDILISNLFKGILKKLKLIGFLKKVLLIKEYKAKIINSGKSLKFVITGDLSIPREDFVKLLEEKGHRVIGSISKNSDYLITNTPFSGTVKNKKAQELGLPIITENECKEKFLK
jgi:DNA ligase (NAD+)